MRRFLHGHAAHDDWRQALASAVAQIDAQVEARRRSGSRAGDEPTLGWVYFTDAHAAHADAIVAELHGRWPGVEWVGASGIGIAADGVEYFGEPAIALMLGAFERASFQVFSGASPLRDFAAHTAQVHADPATPDLAALVADMAERTAAGYLFGGIASSREDAADSPSRALHIAGDVLHGGLSGVAFTRDVALVSRVTQGCQPFGPVRVVTEGARNVVFMLDGEPALDALLKDAGLAGTDWQQAVPTLRQTLVGLDDAADIDAGNGDPGADHDDIDATDRAVAGLSLRGAFDTPVGGRAFGADTRVRHLVGIDPARRGIAIADEVEPGLRVTFCKRGRDAARRDLVRICAEIRDEVESESVPPTGTWDGTTRRGSDDATTGAPSSSSDAAPASVDAPVEVDADAVANVDAGTGTDAAIDPNAPARHAIAGAIYFSCTGRGGPHFGAPSAELAIVRHALGDVPLVGFFAAGEIARRHLYGYTGVLTVFRQTD